jgi:TolA-binding protein
MDLEREVLSYAIRRLYEAQAEGKITEEERERLAKWYKSRMMEVRDTINRNESVVALHELETMQEDLVKLFSNRFDELTKKVEEMRGALSLKTEEEAQVETAPTPTLELEEAESEKEKEKKKIRKKPAPAAEPSGKTEAEKRIEEIKSEVEKVLERLGQIETEG